MLNYCNFDLSEISLSSYITALHGHADDSDPGVPGAGVSPLLRVHQSFQGFPMKKILASVFLFVLVSGVGEAAEKIRLSISSVDVSFLNAGIAQQRGFFRDEGLDVEVIRMLANISINALATGDIDYSMVFGSVIRGAMVGLPMRVVANFMDSSTHVLLARPQYKSIKELKGKTLGVSTFGATADVAARMMIRHGGLDPEKEMKLVPMGTTAARFAGLKEGIVDVVVLSPPADSEGVKQGFNVVSRAFEAFQMPFSGLGVNLKRLKERPDEVKRMIKAFIRSGRYVRQNREGTVQTLMKWGRTDRESAEATYDATWKIFSEDGSMSQDGLKLVIDLGRESSKISRAVAISEVAEFGPLREAQRELGIKPRQ